MRKILTLLVVATTMTSCYYECVETTYMNSEFYSEYTYEPDPEYGCSCVEETYRDNYGNYYRKYCSVN